MDSFTPRMRLAVLAALGLAIVAAEVAYFAAIHFLG